ncbi:MAG: SDR family NAD(P)-dependent oxidoreductase [Bacteroidetes bacterium]|nr:SDR family NAD(P)-dependent oxidoreductase [Bacteroidota bacterium]
MRILVTGGAGFIGSHLCVELVAKGYNLVVIDNLLPQVHGDKGSSSTYHRIKNLVEFIQDDIRNQAMLDNILQRVDVIVHLAAMTGTGQSMYSVREYIDVNVNGTAGLMDSIITRSNNIRKIIVASSRAIYGEGKYYCRKDGDVYPETRDEVLLRRGKFDPVCPVCRGVIDLRATDENSRIHPSSIYGISKYAQEEIVLNVAKTVGIPAYAFRYQNVYGPGQSLINPYTGILSIFSTVMKNGKEINVYEDGRESRDFVYIDDVVDATVAGIESPLETTVALNVGSGVNTSVENIVHLLGEAYSFDYHHKISGDYRIGDIRHNLADLKRIQSSLGYKPKVNIETGIGRFVNWVESQVNVEEKYDKSEEELFRYGLLRSRE